MKHALQLRIVGDLWTTSWYDDSGKRRWKRFGSVKKVRRSQAGERFNEFYRLWLSDPAVRSPGNQEKLTIRRLAEQYDTWAQGYYRKPSGRPTREADNVRDAVQVAVEHFGSRAAEDFAPADLIVCQEAMAEVLSRRTVNARVNRIRRVFRWAVQRGMVSAETWYGLKAVEPLKWGRSMARESEPVRPILGIYVAAVLANVPRTLNAMIRLQLLAGMRPGEVCAMRPRDVDSSAEVWVYQPAEHKTQHHGHRRRSYIGPKAQAILEPLLTRKPDAYVFDPREALAERYAACPTHRSRPNLDRRTARKVRDHYDTGTYRRAIKRACREAGIPEWSPGQLRHNCATEIRAKFGIEAARLVLGHTKIETTQIYAERDESNARRIIREIG